MKTGTGDKLKERLRAFALCRVSVLMPSLVSVVLYGCGAKLTVQTVQGAKSADNCSKANTKKICSPATQLSFGSTSLTASRLINAVWTRSPSGNLAGQKIQVFNSDNCTATSKVGDDVELSSAKIEMYNIIANKEGNYSFKIVSVGSSGDSVISDCSSTIRYSVTALVQVSNDKIAPTLSSIGPKDTPINKTRSGIRFQFNDNTTLACSSQYLQMSSSNEAVVSSGSAAWSGNFPSCSLAVTPIANALGSTTLTIRGSDVAGNTTTTSFTMKVTDAFTIGQPLLDSTLQFVNGQSGPSGVITVGDKLYVSDYNNARVLFWNSIPTATNQSPDGALGQSELGTFDYQSSLQSHMGTPAGLASDGSHFAVVDSTSHRVLIWNSLPTVGLQSASTVLGQPDFSSVGSLSPSANSTSLQYPTELTSCNGKLMVADTGNNRVLIWNSFPASNQVPADVVIGQTNMTANGSGAASASSLHGPKGVHCSNSKIYVSDTLNHRVLIFNSIPTVNGASADLVVGQSDFTSTAVATSSTALSQPVSAYSDGTRLVVADGGSARVMIWTSIPTSNGQAANLVLGQTDFVSVNDYSLNASVVNPNSITMNGQKLIITDSTLNRTLIWNTFPSSINQPADIVLGQPNATYSGSQNVADPSMTFGSEAIFTDGAKLLVADPGSNRVLIWNSIATASTQQPDVILGQSDFYGTSSSRTASTFSYPIAVYYDGTKVYVADALNHRVLIWNSFPTTNKQAADVVIGQPNFTTGTIGRSATVMNHPISLLVNGGKLYVGETFNFRILVWNTIPTVSGQAADFVIGQTNFTNNATGCTASSVSRPIQMMISGGKLYVADEIDGRILVWNTVPTASGSNASFAIGVPNLTTCGGGATPDTGMSPTGLAITSGGKLYVSDYSSNRILYWNTLPTADGFLPDGVFGQANLTSGNANGGGTMNGSTLSNPGALSLAGGRLYITDRDNKRILSIPEP
jgi:hypothetical protein